MSDHVTVRPLEWNERPPRIPYVPGVTGYGGGCDHRYQSGHPCGNSGQYLVGDERLCWSHTSARIRQLMFRKVPIDVKVAA